MSPIVISPILLAIWLACSFLLGTVVVLSVAAYAGSVSSLSKSPAGAQPVPTTLNAIGARRFWAIVGLMAGGLLWLFGRYPEFRV